MARASANWNKNRLPLVIFDVFRYAFIFVVLTVLAAKNRRDANESAAKEAKQKDDSKKHKKSRHR